MEGRLILNEGPTKVRRTPSRDRQRGFSFLEILMVMGVMSMLMGLAIGIMSPGGAARIKQAQSILEETARKCIGASVGNRRAVFQLRELTDDNNAPYLQVSGTVAETVMTHNFETVEEASMGTFADVSGTVKAVPGGYVGNGAEFTSGGVLLFSAQPKFAMTEGFALDVRINPRSGPQEMDIIEGGDSYRVSLVRPGKSDRYDVKVTLKLRDYGANARESNGKKVPYVTKDAPVRANGRWSRVEVEFDGRDVSLRVNGMERLAFKRKRTEARVQDAELRRIAIPELGAVPLSISTNTRPFSGVMDSLLLRGTFRSKELERRLTSDLTLISPQPPVRVVYVNGQMDPQIHSAPVIMMFRDEGEPDDLPLRLVLGQYGTVEGGLGEPEGTEPAKAQKSTLRKPKSGASD